jgi:hypothetical protein
MVSNICFRKSCRLRDNVEKRCRGEQSTDGNMVHGHCMLDAEGYKHTLRISNTYCFSTVRVVARKRLTIHSILPVLLYTDLTNILLTDVLFIIVLRVRIFQIQFA